MPSGKVVTCPGMFPSGELSHQNQQFSRPLAPLMRIRTLGGSRELMRVINDYRQLEAILGTEAARAAVMKAGSEYSQADRSTGSC